MPSTWSYLELMLDFRVQQPANARCQVFAQRQTVADEYSLYGAVGRDHQQCRTSRHAKLLREFLGTEYRVAQLHRLSDELRVCLLFVDTDAEKRRGSLFPAKRRRRLLDLRHCADAKA